MEPKQFHRRAWGLVALLALMLITMGSTLYDLQINQGEEFYRRSQFKIAETQTVEAARGQIVDRNGQVLVSNQASYRVRLDPKLMGDARNDTLLALINIAREEEVSWVDTLPISAAPPFVYTTEEPFTYTSADENGQPHLCLTRLGKLSVKMGWIEDPTREKEPEEQVVLEEPGFFEKLEALLTGRDLTPPPPPPKDSYPPTAEELLGRMCRSFGLHAEDYVDPKALPEGEKPPVLNIGSLDPGDARAVAGLLYELELRKREVYQVTYYFADEVDIDFISKVKEQRLNGVVIEPVSVRQYNTPYAAHLLGRTTPIYADEWEDYKDVDLDGDGVPDYQMDDTVGRDGVEKAFESYLRGKPGVRTLERNTSGKVVSSTWLEEPQPGHNVVLTLDIGLQAKVEEALAAGLPELNSEETAGAACVILDVNNAEVLAAASYPTFDLATFSQDYNDLAQDPLKPMLNRALQGLTPPGSTFKPITAIGGLEEGIITPSTKIHATGVYHYYPGFSPKCWIYREHGRTHGTVDVTKAIEVSCNYFFFDVGRRLGIDRLDAYAHAFGLGERTGLELYEEKGVMAGPEFTESLGGTWYEGSTLSVAIGQESTQVTPIQLANYVATLVNGGTRNATHLLKEVKSSDFTQVLETHQPEVLSTIDIHPQNLEAVKAGMLSLTQQGSVHRAFQDVPVLVGGKTGSAQVSSKKEANALFICFAPYEDPEIAMALVVEHGAHGSDLGYIAADILKYYFSVQESRDELPTENILIQ